MPGQPVVEHDRDAADREGENEAFEVEAGPLREIEKAGRIPVFGDEQGFG